MKNKQKQSGFIILIVTIMIPLVGIGILIAIRHSRILIDQTHQRSLQADARNIAVSVQAWACLHRTEIQASPEGQIHPPDLSRLDILHASCRVEVISKTASDCVVEITAVSKSGTKSWTVKQTLTLTR